MSGKHVKLRAWRRGGGTPVKSVLLGGAAWVSVSAVLAVAVSGEPLTEHRADPALPSPSTLPADQTRDPVVTRSTGADREARGRTSPSADASRQAAERALREGILKAIEDTAGTALAATPDATPADPDVTPSPSTEPDAGSDASGEGSSDSGESGSGGSAPSDDEESAGGDGPEDDEPSDDPGPSVELPTEPTLPPIELP